MTNKTRTIAGFLAGAGLMYLMDPDRGARRRALVRDQAVRARHRLAEGAGATGRDLRNRARGTAAEIRSRFRREIPDDEILREARAELAQDNWAPAARLAAGTIGGGALYRGLRSEGLAGLGLVGIGGLLLLRALTNLPARRLTGLGAGRRAVNIRKAIHVAAPVERVWELWSDFESWPRFMSHLKEVRRTGAERSHWIAKGPGGKGVEWDAVTTHSIPSEVIAWKTVEGSTIEHSGRVYFNPDERGGTLIEVRMSYNPPAGAVGHTVASLLGVDPESAMDEDMVRLKSLLEEGKTTADQGPVRLEDLPASQAPKAQ